MLAVWPMTSLPALRNGGANGGRALHPPSMNFIITGTPRWPPRRAHVDVVGARLLQCQADELAAPLDRRPVMELVAHGRGPSAHTRKEKLTRTISRVGAFLAFTVARHLPYAVLSRGMIRSAFSRSIAIRSAPAKTAPSPFTCSSPVRYG